MFSNLPLAIVSVAFAFLANAISDQLTSKFWMVVLTSSGAIIIGLSMHVFKARRRKRKSTGPAPVMPTPQVLEPIDGSTGRGSVRWLRRIKGARRFELSVAGLALIAVLAAFIVLDMSLFAALAMAGTVVVAVTPSYLGAILGRFQDIAINIGTSAATIVLTTGAVGAVDGLTDPGDIAGTWQGGEWVYLQDDPNSINSLSGNMRFVVTAQNCFGQRCDYELILQTDEGSYDPVKVEPGADGVFRGTSRHVVDCVRMDNPHTVVVSEGYDLTEAYRLTVAEYDGPPGRQKPSVLEVEVTDIGKPTEAARLKNCQETTDALRTTATPA